MTPFRLIPRPSRGLRRIVFVLVLGYNIRIFSVQNVTKQTPKNLANILVFCFGVSLFFSNTRDLRMFLFAQVGSPETQQASEQGTGADPAGSSAESGFEAGYVPGAPVNEEDLRLAEKVTRRAEFLQKIKDQLKAAQDDYLTIKRSTSDTKDKLVAIQDERLTLQRQLSILNRQIEETVTITQNVLVQISEKENQIEMLKNDIRVKDLEIENQKMMLSEYLQVLYEQENELYDTTDQDKAVNIAKLLLSDKSPEEALRELHYFNILEATGLEIFKKLEELVSQQQTYKVVLENSRNKLEMLYRQLEEQQSVLETQQQAKAQLLEETKGQETIYQQLLEESEREQEQVLHDINALRENLEFIQQKIAELGDKFDPANFSSILDKDTTNVYEYIRDSQDEAFQPRWPVSPSRGISAYYRDESYRLAMGIPHDAVDIRALQGTAIKAPADGVVYKARDNGYGYSYIILAHGGGFMTVYGHVMEIRVEEGEKILAGQTIGLSGGMPGTKGAGLLTTGPHLHFEVLKGGKHVDPLDYLPLSYLPVSTLPEKYLNRITGDPTKVKRTAGYTDGVSTSQELLQMMETNGGLENDSGLETEGMM